MEYLIPLAIFAALGILAGVLLTVASKVFAVEVDERVDAIAEALPQANCGACGFSGCADYADTIVNKAFRAVRRATGFMTEASFAQAAV